MSGRRFLAAKAKYGFNGQLKDNEVYGEGNEYSFGMRIYDSRLGRFLSVDPLTRKFAFNSAYNYAQNRPIDGIDVEGLEWIGAFTFGKEKVWDTAFVKKTTASEQINIPINKAGDGGYSDFFNALKTASGKDPHGIGFLAIFAHGAHSTDPTKPGNMMFANADIHPEAGNVYSFDIANLKTSIDAGEIKFAPGAIIYIGACNSGTEFEEATTLAQEIANVTGVKVIAMKGTKVGPKDPNSKDNTTFVPYNSKTGQWHTFEKDKEPVLYGDGKKVDVSTLGKETINQVKENIKTTEAVKAPEPETIKSD